MATVIPLPVPLPDPPPERLAGIWAASDELYAEREAEREAQERMQDASCITPWLRVVR